MKNSALDTVLFRLEDLTSIGPSTVCKRGLLARLFNLHERGLFANTNIQAGQKIGDYEGDIVTPHTLTERDEDTTYVLWLKDQDTPTGIRGRNALRFANHSRDNPNIEPRGQEFFALRDIKAGEELTWRYGDFDYS